MADLFEAEHMVGGAEVRHRDKRVSRKMAAILGVWAPFCWAVAAFVAFANAGSQNPVPSVALPFVVGGIAALGAMFAMMAVSFAVLRTVITNEHVLIKYGLWGPKIPLAHIKSCTVRPYDWTKYGGWGIRYGANGSRAYVPASGDVVVIEYDDDGTTRVVELGAEQPVVVANEINRARQALGGKRIAVQSEESAVDDEIAAEQEALAAEESAKETRDVSRTP